MQDGVEQRVRQLMADLFRLDPDRIDENTSTENVEAWDSANHISLVVALEEEFSLSFDIAEIETMTSFFDIVHVVTTKA